MAAEDLTGADVPVRERLVVLGATYDTHYEVGQLPLAAGVSFCSAIAVCEIDGKILVCVPGEVWNRKVANRLLSPRLLSKVVGCSITACDEETREPVDTADGGSMKVWLGLLSEDSEALLDFGREDPPEHNFGLGAAGEPLVPLGQALQELANERFSYQTAESDLGSTGGKSRLDKLEATMISLQENLNALVGQGVQKTAGRKPALVRDRGTRTEAPPRISFAPTSAPTSSSFPPPPGLSGYGGAYQGLGPNVVNSALSAGIPSEHISEMAALLAQHPQRMEDMPRPSQRRGGGAEELGESAEEEEIPEDLQEDQTGTGAEASGGSVEKAIAQLTKVCTALAAPQMKKGPQIEQLLDGSGLAQGEGSGSTGARKNATALRALRRCLAENPEYLYTTVEAALLQDFQTRALRPGEPVQSGAVRGWLESRSRITNHQPHVRWSWAVGAIWECLIQNKVKEARARAALLIAAADQTSIDSGSWLLSGVALLEPPPPFHAFATHQSPAPQELQHSSLLDPRWMELFLSHVKELDTYQETKKKLSKPSAAVPRAEPEAKPKAKAKPKSKGKGKGGGSAETEADASAQA